MIKQNNKELKMTKQEQLNIDIHISKMNKDDISMYALSILSDVQHTSNSIQRNAWINQAKYVIGKHLKPL